MLYDNYSQKQMAVAAAVAAAVGGRRMAKRLVAVELRGTNLAVAAVTVVRTCPVEGSLHVEEQERQSAALLAWLDYEKLVASFH